MKRIALLICAVLFCSSAASAETLNFGGDSERFGGRQGDRTPPSCQFTAPSAATSPFFVQWNCEDNDARTEDIRTELWIYRGGNPGELLRDFLGFPASVQIDAGVLQVTNFTDGLPVYFRLVARDRAGNATYSEFLGVFANDNSLAKCDLSIMTEATESSGSSTGVPSLTVEIDNATVSSQQTSSTALTLATTAAAEAATCEIESVCDNGDEVSFSASATIDSSDNSATGFISVSPGSVTLTATGSASYNGTTLSALSLSGSTIIDGQTAVVSISCLP